MATTEKKIDLVQETAVIGNLLQKNGNIAEYVNELLRRAQRREIYELLAGVLRDHAPEAADGIRILEAFLHAFREHMETPVATAPATPRKTEPQQKPARPTPAGKTVQKNPAQTNKSKPSPDDPAALIHHWKNELTHRSADTVFRQCIADAEKLTKNGKIRAAISLWQIVLKADYKWCEDHAAFVKRECKTPLDQDWAQENNLLLRDKGVDGISGRCQEHISQHPEDTAACLHYIKIAKKHGNTEQLAEAYDCIFTVNTYVLFVDNCTNRASELANGRQFEAADLLWNVARKHTGSHLDNGYQNYLAKKRRRTRR